MMLEEAHNYAGPDRAEEDRGDGPAVSRRTDQPAARGFGTPRRNKSLPLNDLFGGERPVAMRPTEPFRRWSP
jgi:hypothetical protein